MGNLLVGASPIRGFIVPTVAKGKGVHREVAKQKEALNYSKGLNIVDSIVMDFLRESDLDNRETYG